MSLLNGVRIELVTDPEVEGVEIGGIDGVPQLMELIDQSGNAVWFRLTPEIGEPREET